MASAVAVMGNAVNPRVDSNMRGIELRYSVTKLVIIFIGSITLLATISASVSLIVILSMVAKGQQAKLTDLQGVLAIVTSLISSVSGIATGGIAYMAGLLNNSMQSSTRQEHGPLGDASDPITAEVVSPGGSQTIPVHNDGPETKETDEVDITEDLSDSQR